jgi:aldehyde dehydrogenase (NAD+)
MDGIAIKVAKISLAAFAYDRLIIRLHAAVIGTDVGRARRVASQLRVVINGMTNDPQAPWGGFKYSGVGREYGRYGIQAFLETCAILEA